MLFTFVSWFHAYTWCILRKLQLFLRNLRNNDKTDLFHGEHVSRYQNQSSSVKTVQNRIEEKNRMEPFHVKSRYKMYHVFIFQIAQSNSRYYFFYFFYFGANINTHYVFIDT